MYFWIVKTYGSYEIYGTWFASNSLQIQIFEYLLLLHFCIFLFSLPHSNFLLRDNQVHVPRILYQWREIVARSLSFSLKLDFPHPQLLWGFQRFIVREDVNVTLTFYCTLFYFWDIENENIKLFHRPMFLNT